MVDAMRHGFTSATRGFHYALRGLREGRRSLLAAGIVMIAARAVRTWRHNSSRVTEVRLEAGEGVTLQVTERGD